MHPQPRRRADDWRETSPIKLGGGWFTDIASRLGYDPSRVMSIRINRNEVVVTFRRPDGMPSSMRHELVNPPPIPE